MKKGLPIIFKILLIALIVGILVMLVNLFGKPDKNMQFKLVTPNYTLEPGAYEENGEIMVPLRSFCDFLGADVMLDTENFEYEIKLNEKSIKISNGETKAVFGEEEIQLKNAPTMHQGLLYVPFDIFSEYLDVDVETDEENKIITVEKD